MKRCRGVMSSNVDAGIPLAAVRKGILCAACSGAQDIFVASCAHWSDELGQQDPMARFFSRTGEAALLGPCVRLVASWIGAFLMKFDRYDRFFFAQAEKYSSNGERFSCIWCLCR
jgi:hypothetical protein